MIARFHYDDQTFDRLLRNAPVKDQQEIVKHVETCEQCQARLESITQDGLTWEEAGELLRDNPLDEPVGFPSNVIDSRASKMFLQPSDHPESLGRFGRYEIMEFLGRGGMGIVMRGFDPALNRYSAIKVLAPELATSAAARMRFSREAKSAAAVVHPHVVPIQTVDEHDGMPYLVMPVVEGKSLQQRVDQSGPLSIVEVVRIAAQIAEGLAAAHAQGLVHRDIKPANILLENGVERVQITDFGLARAVDDASMTRSGVIAGTPQYMSPEQAHGDEIDHRSDLFSLGSVIYFMLTGRSPFRAETTMGVLNRIVNDEPRRLQAIEPSIPAWLQSIVMRLLEKSPNKRFDSAESIAAVLNGRLAQLQNSAYDANEPKTISFLRLPPTIKWTMLASGAMAAIVYLTIFVLQTKDGTIRIETNGELDQAVPLVIKQGDEVVQRLMVESQGATTRVRAGSYSVEFDGENKSFELKDNKAVVKADGVWITRIEFAPSEKTHGTPTELQNQAPNAVRELALKDIQHGRYEEALKRILWYWDNAVTIDPALVGVRRSFLLSDWLGLGEVYPPALAKLRSIRDDLETRILSKDQVRVRSDDFADFATINQTLRQDEQTNRVFEELKQRDPQDAERLRPWLPESMRSSLNMAPARVNPPKVVSSDITAPGEETMPNFEVALNDAVRQFNRRMINSKTLHPDFDQPELTEQEMVTWALWNLRTDKQLSDETRAALSMIALERRLPIHWNIACGFTFLLRDAPHVKSFVIALIDARIEDKSRHVVKFVRQRYLSLDPPTTAPQPNATPLTTAISEFNAIHNSIVGIRQPPLTIDEVLAAITLWRTRREQAAVDNATFEAFLNIAKTQEFPSGVKFEVIPSFATAEGETFNIWSVRILMPQIAKPGSTYAFLIREQFISVDSVDSTVIHWGTPAENGLQAGVRLKPSQRDYMIGQKIDVEFFLRSINGKAIEANLPNFFTFDTIKVIDSEGKEVQAVEHQEQVIGGWESTSIDEQPTRKVGQSIQIVGARSPVDNVSTKDARESNTGATIRATPGQTYRLQFTVSNFAANEKQPLNTGEVEFHVFSEPTR